MNNPIPAPPGRAQHHPLLLLAALAVVLFCLVGTAAIMGWIPSSIGGNDNRQLTAAERSALAANMPSAGQPLQSGATSAEMAQLAQGNAVVAQPMPPAAPMAPAQAQYPAQYPAQQPAQYPAQQVAQGYGPAPVASERYVEQRQPEPEYRPAPRTTVKPKPVQLAKAEPKWCGNCGNVESVRAVKHRAQGSGLGAAGGAVLGGLLGNQIGGGSGRQIATVAGAVGGAVVGNQVEGNMKATTTYEIRVRLDDGSLRTFKQSSAPQWSSGDRVRIVKGRLRSAA